MTTTIGNSWLNRTQQLYQAQAALPAALNQMTSAISLLQGVISSFQQGGAATPAGGQPSALPFVTDLISKYMGMGLGGAQSLQNIEKLLGDIVAQLSARALSPAAAGAAPGTPAAGGTVVPPAAQNRDFGSEIKQIVELLTKLLGALTGQAGTTGAAGTGAPAGTGTTAGTGTAGTGTAAAGAATGTGAATTTTGGASDNGSIDSIIQGALTSNSGELNADEQQMLANIKDPNQRAMMAAQLRLQHAQEIVSFLSNALKKKGDTAMAVIRNLA